MNKQVVKPRTLHFHGVNVNLDSPEFIDKKSVDNWTGFEHLPDDLQKEGLLAINLALGFMKAPKADKPLDKPGDKTAEQ